VKAASRIRSANHPEMGAKQAAQGGQAEATMDGMVGTMDGTMEDITGDITGDTLGDTAITAGTMEGGTITTRAGMTPDIGVRKAVEARARMAVGIRDRRTAR